MNRRISRASESARAMAESNNLDPCKVSAQRSTPVSCRRSILSLEPVVSRKRVLVADRYPLVRYGLAVLIDEQADLVCCGEADTVASVNEAVAFQNPDLLITSLRLQCGDTFELLKSLREAHPDLAILVVSELPETIYASRCILCGASGYLPKSAVVAALLDAIRSVLAGNLHLSAKMSARLLCGTFGGSSPAAAKRGPSTLSDRELQVFQMLGGGLGSREIAADLGISVKTVDSHRENIKQKLGIHDSHELLRHASLFVSGAFQSP